MGLLGFIRRAAVPATSGREEELEVMVGVPHWRASRTGRPKPS